MNISSVAKFVENNYDITASSIEKIKNVYKIIDYKNNAYCLKVVRYNLKHFLFILSAMKHLQNNGFKKIPGILPNNKGQDYIKFEKNYAYMTKWINCRQCSFDNPIDVSTAVNKLAQLHIKSQNFYITKDMEPRIGWFRWIKTFYTRKDEILDFKKKINLKEDKSEFDSLYLDMIQEEVFRANKSIENLIQSEYLNKMLDEINKRGFCHHDLAHHNILIDNKGEVNIIDFDYCMLDSSLHDLSSIMIRIMKNGKWSIDTAKSVLKTYDKTKKIEPRDITIMAAFMEFPQDYWQVGIQYYWEMQPWSNEFFLNKLNKIYEDREEKQEFIEEFRLLKI
ncbi:CotS family spore coat protein [Clostridium niameyense]|uniref:CotS family spore coat protein n=1 Tax=Clostridium niameyense TaxID=1622073 RepID=UPI00067E74C6|nr:CotS family spore coat protein [Clostridium niameyense]